MNHKTAAASQASAVSRALAALPDSCEPTVKERVAAWWFGEHDEEIAFAIGMADMVAPDPVAKILYQFHCAEDMVGSEAVHALSAWCAGMAAESVCTVNSRHRPKIASYKPHWGRQAGRDGACLAMWGDAIRDLMPGVNARAAQYGCRDAAYLAVRDYVRIEACDLIDTFARDMEMAVSGKFDRGFRERWERVTGRRWSQA